jgi:hypothetical protein
VRIGETTGFVRLRRRNSIIEGRERAAVGALAIVLCANRLGLPPVSDANPMQFGRQREEGAASAPTTATLLFPR